MFRVLRRTVSTHHSRDINCVFEKNRVTYSIPLYYPGERALFGNTLELQIDLSSLATGKYVIKKGGERPSHTPSCADPAPFLKSYLVPELKLLT